MRSIWCAEVLVNAGLVCDSFRSRKPFLWVVVMPICPNCETRGEQLHGECPSGDGYFLVEEDEYYGYSADDWLGRRLGDRFIISSILGKGSMGHVYKAYQKQVDRMVAMKIFETDNVMLSDEEGPATKERFIQEARVLAKLSHPNCVTLYDFGYDSDDDFLYIAMEHVAGISLRRAVRRGLKFDAIVEVVRQVLMALREAHALEIVHRDLKPENIILSYRQTSEEQIVKVLDFGIAKLLRKDPGKRTRAGLLFGTPAYMSPEQCRGETDVTPASDIYSLGCMTFEMITGYLPFDSDLPQEMVRQHQYEPIPDLVPRKGMSIPDGIEEFVRTCMEKEPEDRYAHAARALQVFENIVGGDARAAPLAKGLASLDDGTLSRRVAVPDNRVTGAELDPTGERDRPDLDMSTGSSDVPASTPTGDRSLPEDEPDVDSPVQITETARGVETKAKKKVSGPGLFDRLSGRSGLVASAVVAVSIFCTLLIAALYLAFSA